MKPYVRCQYIVEHRRIIRPIRRHPTLSVRSTAMCRIATEATEQFTWLSIASGSREEYNVSFIGNLIDFLALIWEKGHISIFIELLSLSVVTNRSV